MHGCVCERAPDTWAQCCFHGNRRKCVLCHEAVFLDSDTLIKIQCYGWGILKPKEKIILISFQMTPKRSGCPPCPTLPATCCAGPVCYHQDELRYIFNPWHAIAPNPAQDNLSHCNHLLHPLGFLKPGCRTEPILLWLLLKTNKLIGWYHELGYVCLCMCV